MEKNLNELIFGKNILDLQQEMDQGELTSVELVKFFLNRIQKYDQQGPKLRSIINVNECAVEQARELDEERKKKGKRSNLHGIPVVIKDNVNTKDMPTTAASVLMVDNRPEEDAFIVDLLRKAGAVILAKTNLSEFATNGFTCGMLVGQTLNPYDLTRTPGGSSGGTAASVAAYMAVAGIGSDTMNSARSPASATNLFGLRPTTGLLSRTGVVPNSWSEDTAGILTRSAMDMAIMLDQTVGYDEDDEMTSEQVTRTPDSYTTYVKEDGMKGKRIGLLRTNYGNDPEILRVMEQAEKLMVAEGAELIELNIPEFETERVIDECDIEFYEYIEGINQYFANEKNCPLTCFDDIINSGKIIPSTMGYLNLCSTAEKPCELMEYKDKYLKSLTNRRHAYKIMAKYNLDAIAYPHQKILVEKAGLNSQRGRNGMLAVALAFPALSVPAGFSIPTQDAPVGIPVGLEFMARAWDEPILIEIASGFEHASKLETVPPMTP